MSSKAKDIVDFANAYKTLEAKAKAAGKSPRDYAMEIDGELRKIYGPRWPEHDIQGAYYQPPYTTVKWSDGTTTTVKCDAEDTYDPEKGVLLCFAKRLFAGGRFNDALRKALGMVPDLSHERVRTIHIDGHEVAVYANGTMCIVADYADGARWPTTSL